jgi:hypothetical protein
MSEEFSFSFLENSIPIGIFCIFLWLILKKAPETLVNPIKKLILLAGLVLLVKLIRLVDIAIFEFLQDSIIANLIRDTFEKSEEWFEGFIDGIVFIISAAIYGYLLSVEFSSKKAKK